MNSQSLMSLQDMTSPGPDIWHIHTVFFVEIRYNTLINELWRFQNIEFVIFGETRRLFPVFFAELSWAAGSSFTCIRQS